MSSDTFLAMSFLHILSSSPAPCIVFFSPFAFQTFIVAMFPALAVLICMLHVVSESASFFGKGFYLLGNSISSSFPRYYYFVSYNWMRLDSLVDTIVSLSHAAVVFWSWAMTLLRLKTRDNTARTAHPHTIHIMTGYPSLSPSLCSRRMGASPYQD